MKGEDIAAANAINIILNTLVLSQTCPVSLKAFIIINVDNVKKAMYNTMTIKNTLRMNHGFFIAFPVFFENDPRFEKNFRVRR